MSDLTLFLSGMGIGLIFIGTFLGFYHLWKLNNYPDIPDGEWNEWGKY